MQYKAISALFAEEERAGGDGLGERCVAHLFVIQACSDEMLVTITTLEALPM
jgi:hypothetical protein